MTFIADQMPGILMGAGITTFFFFVLFVFTD